MQQHVLKAFQDAKQALSDFIISKENLEKVEKVGSLIASRLESGNKVIIFGNGGSSCDAAHFAEEFTGRYRKDRRALPVMVINESAHLSCVGNDFGFEAVFLRGVEAFLKPGDVVIGLSTSGNSANVLKALDYAKQAHASTVALLGKGGGKMKGKYDFEWISPGLTSDRIQEIHMTILHILIEVIERKMFPDHYE